MLIQTIIIFLILKPPNTSIFLKIIPIFSPSSPHHERVARLHLHRTDEHRRGRKSDPVRSNEGRLHVRRQVRPQGEAPGGDAAHRGTRAGHRARGQGHTGEYGFNVHGFILHNPLNVGICVCPQDRIRTMDF